MSLAIAVADIREVSELWLEAVVAPAPVTLEDLLHGISDLKCGGKEFREEARRLSEAEAHSLLTATLYRSMAYSVEYMPIEQARRLASRFILAAGEGCEFWSTCFAEDEVNGVSNYFMLTSHTFEATLYCSGRNESALLVAVDED